jgi:hypothetical protein
MLVCCLMMIAAGSGALSFSVWEFLIIAGLAEAAARTY